MKAFVCARRPRSVNASGNATYQRFIREAYANYCDNSQLEAPCYGRVYYFRNVAHQLDADNLSKPVLDALRGLAYGDDSQVQFRQSGIIDLTIDDISNFDISRMPSNVVDDFIAAIGVENHLIYVEIGPLDKNMFSFGAHYLREE